MESPINVSEQNATTLTSDPFLDVLSAAEYLAAQILKTPKEGIMTFETVKVDGEWKKIDKPLAECRRFRKIIETLERYRYLVEQHAR
jgi:hypothetical protein